MNHQLVHTQDFIKKWKIVLKKLYYYEEYMDFMVVPSISFNKSLSYLPLLNYTDRTSNNIDDLLELSKDNDFQIRVLNFGHHDFKDNDTVTMRLDINSNSKDEIFSSFVKSRCRNKIRNSIKKNNFIIKNGNDDNLIEDFYLIFSNTVYKHGTPVFDKQLFYILREELKDNIIFYVVYDDNNKPIATMCILLDEDIAWYPWGGIDDNYSKDLIGYFIYWNVLEDIIKNYDKKIFDFGRSNYGGSTYKFKSQFGAVPVKIDIIKNKYDNIYTKYSLATKIWKRLPRNIINFISPKLCKYLVDL